ncbi:IKI3-domain-containing protein [Gonapodya prolifera JEL478]|uniref:IKI3-domain-containing protein n=1 Tax=Gonapodya prolifera (strain JEL478) TaxID=1344416 RepID=A0A139A5Q4_GONPJ|nr:IKI3-domain-containing protein [Gonapodya prolifera JEL478]|eukprot:KXS12071.1 IKI3-domain-containing protein [Gonapodya prolifera JEL478]
MEESHRRIERGATIVTAVQGGLAVILQMPRGNLETIYPRALAIIALQKKLDSSNYREALELCREHRISMNLLCDHNRTKFLEDSASFVSQVKKSWLKLGTVRLTNSDEDVTTTQYKMFYNNRTPTPQEDRTKVTAVCQKLCSVIQSLSSEEYIQTILTTFVKESPPCLEDTLTSIQYLRQMKGSKAADEATKYIVFLVDANTLFHVALGMYDFGLVVMIAQHSHKVNEIRNVVWSCWLTRFVCQWDPKEYLAFLSQLRTLDKPIQRFRIDDYLKRHSKTLKNLSEASQDHFSEALTYISRHKLHSVALDIFSEKSQPKEVLKLFSEPLVDGGQHCEAGISEQELRIMLTGVLRVLPGGNRELFEGLFWREAMASAHLAKQDKESIEKLCADMADELREDRRWNDAAELLHNYSEDVEGAVWSYCLGGNWEQATLAALSRGQEALVESVIKPALIDELERVSSGLGRDPNGQVSAHPQGKNRRKFERKKLSGMEGSQYEEEYLVTYFKKTF